MIDFVITLSVAAFFAAAWASGKYLPKLLAVFFPIAVVVAVVVVTVTVGMTSVRDWLMAGVAICITTIVALAGRDARRKATRKGSSVTDASG